MRTILISCFAATVAVFAYTGSASAQSGPKEQQGTVGGALFGSAIGSMFGNNAGEHVMGGLIGGAVGGFIGNRIGAQLDEEDRAALERATRQSLATGAPVQFKNPKSGVKAKVTIVASTKGESGEPCRTVQQEVTMADGTVSKDKVSACKGPNGWGG